MLYPVGKNRLSRRVAFSVALAPVLINELVEFFGLDAYLQEDRVAIVRRCDQHSEPVTLGPRIDIGELTAFLRANPDDAVPTFAFNQFFGGVNKVPLPGR